MVAEGKDALMEEFFEKGTLPVEHILDGLNVSGARDAPVSRAVRLGAAQYRFGPDPESDRGQSSGAQPTGEPLRASRMATR